MFIIYWKFGIDILELASIDIKLPSEIIHDRNSWFLANISSILSSSKRNQNEAVDPIFVQPQLQFLWKKPVLVNWLRLKPNIIGCMNNCYRMKFIQWNIRYTNYKWIIVRLWSIKTLTTVFKMGYDNSTMQHFLSIHNIRCFERNSIEHWQIYSFPCINQQTIQIHICWCGSYAILHNNSAFIKLKFIHRCSGVQR